MSSRFYINIDALNEYSKFLKKCIVDINKQVTDISKANNQYQMVCHDNVAPQVDLHIKKLKKVFDKFSLEIDKMSKNVQKDYEKFNRFNKKSGGII